MNARSGRKDQVMLSAAANLEVTEEPLAARLRLVRRRLRTQTDLDSRRIKKPGNSTGYNWRANYDTMRAQ